MKFLLSLLVGGLFLINRVVGIEAKSINQLSSEKKNSFFTDDEKLILERFFQQLVKSDGLGYVLFGSKPACMSGFFSCMPLGNHLSGCNASYRIKAGWRTWKKYKERFSHPKYLIFEERKKTKEIEINSIFFINKEKLLKTLEVHHDLFKEGLGRDFDPKQFLKKIEEEGALYRLLRGHEGLLGIILGYGVESSMNYHKRDLVLNYGMPLSYEETDFQTVCAESFERVQTDIKLIQFAGNPSSPEVKAIMELNLKERIALIKIYERNRFLEISLKKLTEE